MSSLSGRCSVWRAQQKVASAPRDPGLRGALAWQKGRLKWTNCRSTIGL